MHISGLPKRGCFRRGWYIQTRSDSGNGYIKYMTDSTYILYKIITQHKLKPLVVSWDHGFYREGHMRNVERTLKILGADFHVFRPNMKVVGQLMLESLKRKGDFCWHCHSGVFAYPMQIAVKYNIPLLIWGESTAEYTGYYDFDEDEWEEQLSLIHI